ncbi:MAG: efflux RND transporter periplasmic adaptor subunit [Bacteroidales bacterium]|nr:efflux RND transporter periplasmic adaptor subunit [Bacteroidales bacterium]
MTKGIIILAASVCMLSSCSKGLSQEATNINNTATDTLKSVLKTAEVTEEKISEELEVNAEVVCNETRMSKVFVPCIGKISGIKAEIGDKVSQNQILATINSTDAANYDKQLSEAHSELAIAKRELEMKSDMLSSGMASAKDVQEAKNRVAVAQAECGRLQSVANINGYANNANALLRAPLSGYVISKNVYNNCYIDDTNNDEPAFVIADLNDIWIIADVYEGDIRKIYLGQDAYVTTMAYGNEKMHGKIDKIYHILDKDSKTMKVRMHLKNKMITSPNQSVQPMLKPGMFATLHIAMENGTRDMATVPSESVIFENGHDYVVIADNDGNYRRQQVKVLGSNDSKTYISDGLQCGSKVVSQNALLIFNALAQ